MSKLIVRPKFAQDLNGGGLKGFFHCALKMGERTSANNNFFFSLTNNIITIHVATFYYTIYDLLTTVY